ncbi:hypothetical protein [Planococcus beigongshangi]|nr:hypothetical protein [Planococcus beigongshangi]
MEATFALIPMLILSLIAVAAILAYFSFINGRVNKADLFNERV